MAVSVQHVVTERELILLDQAALDNPPAPMPTPEEVRAADTFFQSNPETATAGLFAAWGSVMLLHDLAAEHLSRPIDIDEEPKEKEEEKE